MKAGQKIVIAGGGVSGCFAAIAAARAGADVYIYERNDSILKKLLVTGNGRCNISNTSIEKASPEEISGFYQGSFSACISSVYDKFGLKETRRLLTSIGIVLKERGELLYPYSDQAASVKKAIGMELEYLGVHVLTGMKVTGIEKCDELFNITVCEEATGQMLKDTCDRVIIAMGSRAMPSSGSDGFSAKLFKKLKIKNSRYLPALTRCISKDEFVKRLAGLRCKGAIRLYADDEYIASDEGEIQFVKDGISGIVTFQISSVAARLFEEGKSISLILDLCCEYTMEQLSDIISERLNCAAKKKRTRQEALCGFINERLIPVISEYDDIAYALKNFKVNVAGFGDYESCQVCSGGIDAAAINDRLEIVDYPGMFACGENIDADGKCGGFNLQFAISTGYIAGTNAADS